MISAILLILAIYKVSSEPKFVSYIGQAGPGWGTPASDEAFLKVIGVPGYGGSLGYTVLNFAFWVSNSNNGGAAVNGAAYDWQNIQNRIRSSVLRTTLTGTSNPTGDQLRTAIKTLYSNNGIQIFISAFGGADHPMGNGKSATSVANQLASYAQTYKYDGVDIDWEEAISGKFASGAGGETWLCSLTNALRSNSNMNGKKITHAPQAPYFMGSQNGQYPSGGYNKVHRDCGSNIDWYNTQFYNQGSTSYNSYNGLFHNSIGWSSKSAVYEIMNGASPDRVSVPAQKIVVGKHTSGDGSTFVAGSTLKSIFNSALSAGQWNGGFMTWQFYHEVFPSQSDGRALIDHVLDANWGVSTSSRPPSTTTTAPPTRSTTASPTGNIRITNFGTSTIWYYAATISGVSPGFTITKFEIRMSNYAWYTCEIASYAYKCAVTAQISAPLSIRLTANEKTITTYNVITSFNDERVFDFGKNFAIEPTMPPSPTPRPTERPSQTPPTTSTSQTARPTQRPNASGGSRIGVVNRAGSSEWYYTVELDNPSRVSIRSVEMKDSDMTQWANGEYQSWCDCYVFSEYAPYNPPLSFKITTSAGQEITGTGIINSFAAGNSADVGTVSSSYKTEDDNDVTTSWTLYFAIIVVILAICLIGGICVYKQRMRKKGKGYVKEIDTIELRDNDGNKTTVSNATEMIDVNKDDDDEQEIEIEVEAETPITT